MFASKVAEVQIIFSNFSTNVALQGAGIYCFVLPILKSSLFLENIAMMSSQVPSDGRQACQTSSGSGGGIFVSDSCSIDKSLLDSTLNNEFKGKKEENFGGGLAFRCGSASALPFLTNMTRFNFESNVAMTGSNFGSVAQSLSLSRYNVGDISLTYEFRLVVDSKDAFNQRSNLHLCSVALRIGFGNEMFSVKSDSGVLGGLPPYTLYTAVGLTVALMNPPFPLFSVKTEIIAWIVERNLEPTSLFITVSGCDLGQILVGSNEQHAYSRFICQDCVPGRFADYNASSWSMLDAVVGEEAFCSDCPAGRYSGWKSYSCALCPVGRRAQNNGSYQCDECSAGFYQSSTGKTSCDSCEMSKFSSRQSQTMCDSCPSQSITLYTGTFSVFGCVCPKLFYGKPWINGRCYSCVGLPGSQCQDKLKPFKYSGIALVASQM